jgi:hypothetical protein
MGPPGEPGDGVIWKIIDITVYEREWQLVGRSGDLGSFYKSEQRVPELTPFACDNGNVFGYRWIDKDEQTPLGQVFVNWEIENGYEFLFTEVCSFSFRPGYVTFYIDYSDFETGIRHPGNCDFRIVLNY